MRSMDKYKHKKINVGERYGTYEVIEKTKGKYIVKCLCGCETIKELHGHRIIKLGTCVRSKPLSYIGQKNNKTTFLKFLGGSEYECICDCGSTFTGRICSTSCGCLKKENAEQFNGVKFHGIKVISFSHFGIYSKKTGALGAFYNAKCKCGKDFLIKRSNLFKAKSCGCRIVSNFARGERQGNCKTDETTVRSIRELFLTGLYTKKDLSEIFEMNIVQIRGYLQNESWKHVQPDLKILTESTKKNEYGRTLSKIKIGEMFGHWTVIEKLPSFKTHAYYLCECKCGNQHRVISSRLRDGGSTKCFSCNSKALAEKSTKYPDAQVIGKRFGNRVVLSISRKNKQRYACVRCDCGKEDEIMLTPLLLGKSKNCKFCYVRNKKRPQGIEP